MKFTLEIKLGNAAMETYSQIAAAIHYAVSFPESGNLVQVGDTAIIKDYNGNRVGQWTVTADAPVTEEPLLPMDTLSYICTSPAVRAQLPEGTRKGNTIYHDGIACHTTTRLYGTECTYSTYCPSCKGWYAPVGGLRRTDDKLTQRERHRHNLLCQKLAYSESECTPAEREELFQLAEKAEEDTCAVCQSLRHSTSAHIANL